MSLASTNAFCVRERRAQVNVLHLAHGFAEARGHVRCRTERGSGIAGGRLDEQLPYVRPPEDALVELYVQSHTAGEAQSAGFPDDVADIIVDECERSVLEQLLCGCGVMDVGIVDIVAIAHRPQPVHEPLAEIISLAILLVASRTDHVDKVVVYLEALAVVFDQRRQIIFFRITVRCHTHDFVLAILHLEAEVLGNRTVKPAERVRIVELLDLVNSSVFAITEECSCILPFAIDTDDRRLFLEAAQMVSAAGVRQVMLHRHEAHAPRPNPELIQQLQDRCGSAANMPVAI